MADFIQMTKLTVFDGVVPNKLTQTKEEFANNVHPYLNYYNDSFVPESVTFIDNMNSNMDTINSKLYDMQNTQDNTFDYMITAKAVSMYQGDYDADKLYQTGQSVTRDGILYVSKVDDNSEIPPQNESDAYWLYASDEWIETTDDYEAKHLDKIAFDTSEKELKLYLPSGLKNYKVEFMDMKGTFGSNNLVIYPASGEVIMGQDADEEVTVNSDNFKGALMFIDNNWRFV